MLDDIDKLTEKDILDLKEENKINSSDDSDNTPLHNVKNPKVAKLLLDNGADLTIENFWCETPFDTCANEAVAKEFVKAVKDKDELLKILTEQNEFGFNIFHRVKDAGVAKVYMEEIKNILSDKGFSSEEIEVQWKSIVNAQNYDGNTPVHAAAIMHDFELAKFYVENGGNLGIKNNDGKNPIFVLHPVQTAADREMLDKMIDLAPVSNEKKARAKLRFHKKGAGRAEIPSKVVLNDIAVDVFHDGPKNAKKGEQRLEVAKKIWEIKHER